VDNFRETITIQYHRANSNGWLGDCLNAAAQHGTPRELPIALMSRETECNPLYLRQKGDPVIDANTGKVKLDAEGNVVGYGHGLMQVDSRWHPDWCEAKTEDGTPLWHIAHECIFEGMKIFASILDEIKKFEAAGQCKYKGHVFTVPALTETQRYRAAIAGYNCGSAAALYYYLVKGQPDLGTTHHNYSADVLKRAEVFRELIEVDYGK
jgi:hypothetical protein